MSNSKWIETPVRRNVWVIRPEDEGDLSFICSTTAELSDVLLACKLLFPDMTGIEVTPEKADEQEAS